MWVWSELHAVPHAEKSEQPNTQTGSSNYSRKTIEHTTSRSQGEAVSSREEMLQDTWRNKVRCELATKEWNTGKQEKSHESDVTRTVEGKKEKQIVLCKTSPIFPVLCAHNHLVLLQKWVESWAGGQVLSGLGAMGEGSRVRRMALSKGALSALKKDCCSARKQHTEEIEHATRGETHIPMCHDKQRGCVSICSFFHNYCKMCSFCLQSKTASTSSKQRGCLPKRVFSATPSKVEPKVTENKKKGTKPQEKSTHTTSNKIQNTNISPIYT